jgi:TetR/AcrR family transcriptional regulator
MTMPDRPRRNRGAQAPPPTPLYARLPHGPHRLGADAVAQNQRSRMHGAMIEAVANSGYERTSVKQVVGLAGVSRRAFYEQFANKQECFLATFDVIAARGAGRVSAAYAAAGGDGQERMHAAFGELTAAISANQKSAHLAIVEAPKAGAPALLRLRRASATFEQMLCESLGATSPAGVLPAPVIRAIAGGLHAAMSRCLSEGSPETAPQVASEMLRWTLLFQTPAARRLAERLSERARQALVQGRKAPPRDGQAPLRSRAPFAPTGDDRERLLEHALSTAVEVGYRELSAPQIADSADVSIDSFFEHFEGKQECYLAALGMLGERLLCLASEPPASSDGWPQAVRARIGQLLGYLADRPIYAQTIAEGAFAAGQQAIDQNVWLASAIARRLTDGAPVVADGALAVQGVAGALSHTIRCQVASGQIQLLSVLADYLSYIVLAPFVGSEDAARAVIEEP